MPCALPCPVVCNASLAMEADALKTESGSRSSRTSAQGDSDDEIFAETAWCRNSPQNWSIPSERSTESLEGDATPQRSLEAPHMLWLSLSATIPVQQQAAVAATLPFAAETPSVRAPLRSKLSGAAEPFDPWKASSMALAAAPRCLQAAFGALGAPPGLEEQPFSQGVGLPVDSELFGFASENLQVLHDQDADLLWLDEALREASMPKNPRRKRRSRQRRTYKKPAIAGVGDVLRLAISNIEGVAGLEVSTDANGTFCAVQVKLGQPQTADLLQVAKAAMMNASALSTGTYVVGYLGQPFQDFPGGFKAVLGFVHQCDEAEACWSFYEFGSCPCHQTCNKQHPREEQLEPVTVMVSKFG